jgi:hypothetical protein
MGNCFTKTKTDYLESYLNEMYEDIHVCVFQASNEEVEFIKTGIETLVEKIVGYIQQNLMKDDVNLRDKEGLQEQLQYDKNADNDLLKAENINIELDNVRNKNDLIKVGSFYEGTKNKFPDEFDIIFLVSRVDDHHSISSLLETFDDTLKYIAPDEHSKRELYFDKYLGQHGPAFMSQFIYKKEPTCKFRTSEKPIYFDLVPAIRYVTSGDINRNEFNKIVNNVNPKSFREEVLKRGDCLRINTALGYTFTDTELHFIKNFLSPKHVKVFRIIKFLINGDGDDKILEYNLDLENENVGYSSYQIKTMMIYHHEECENADEGDLKDCVMKILQELYKCKHTHDLPAIVPSYKNIRCCCLRDDLKTLIRQMKLLGHHNIEYYNPSSLSNIYIDRIRAEEPWWMKERRVY